MNKKRIEKAKPSIMKGPSLGYTDNIPKRQMWKEIAEECNGEFKISHNSGYGLEIHTIIIPYKKWDIGISVSDSRPLKFIMEFTPRLHFNFTLSREGFIEKIIKKFSKPEIQMGWKDFDDHYLIESNRSDLVKRTITNEIQSTMLKYNVYSLSYQTDPSTKKASLMGVIQRQAGDKDMMHGLIDMFKILADNLGKLK